MQMHAKNLTSSALEFCDESCARIAFVPCKYNPESKYIEEALKSSFIVKSYLSIDKLIRDIHFDTFDCIVIDSYDFTKHIHEAEKMQPLSNIAPLIILSGNSCQKIDIESCNMVLDDVISYKCGFVIFIYRIHAAIRRRKMCVSRSNISLMRSGYKFNDSDLSVSFSNNRAIFTLREFKVLAALFSNIDRPLSRYYIIDTIWGGGTDHLSRTIDTHVNRIRKKMYSIDQGLSKITSIYGYGYKFEIRS